MSIQLIIILIYFALTIIIGVMAGRKTKSADAFTGVALSTVAIVCASTGEWLGGTATTGVSEYGFLWGISGAWYTIANGIGVLFLGLCFAKLFRSLETGTVPGIIEKFFGVKARTVSCIILTIVMLAVGLSQMIAAGKLGESLLGLPFWVSCIVFAIIFIIYTLAGGMNAVASTNVMHLIVMYAGAIVAVVIAVIGAGGWSAFSEGIGSIQASNGGSFWSLGTIGGTKISSWIIASLLGACTAQAGLQPVLSAKNAKQAKKACIITACVAAPFGLFTAMLGMASRVMYENGTILEGTEVGVAAKSALPEFMMNMDKVVPSFSPAVAGILGGLVLASILAAILSTVSPIILAAGTMVTRDVYQRVLHPEATDEQVLKMGRITTAIAGIICCVGAMAIWKLSTVLELVYAAYSLRGALFIIVLLGIYWKKSSQKGAIVGMILTAIVAIGWVGVKLVTGSYPIKIGSFAITETYAAVVVALVATIIFSLIFKQTKEEKADRDATKAHLAKLMAEN